MYRWKIREQGSATRLSLRYGLLQFRIPPRNIGRETSSSPFILTFPGPPVFIFGRIFRSKMSFSFKKKNATSTSASKNRFDFASILRFASEVWIPLVRASYKPLGQTLLASDAAKAAYGLVKQETEFNKSCLKSNDWLRRQLLTYKQATVDFLCWPQKILGQQKLT